MIPYSGVGLIVDLNLEDFREPIAELHGISTSFGSSPLFPRGSAKDNMWQTCETAKGSWMAASLKIAEINVTTKQFSWLTKIRSEPAMVENN